MEEPVGPFTDIAMRLKWHRELMRLTQAEYADKVGFKRARYSQWEGGAYRLSLDGALAIRRKFGLSLVHAHLAPGDSYNSNIGCKRRILIFLALCCCNAKFLSAYSLQRHTVGDAP